MKGGEIIATINNQANLAYQYNTISSNVSSNIVETTIIDPYSITATKRALSSTYRDDSTITYITTINNNGSGSLYNVTITDDLANGDLDLIETTLYMYRNNVLAPITATSYNPLTIELTDPLVIGEEVLILYNATINNTTADTITNTQNISANSGSETGPIITVTPSPSVTITKEDYASLSIVKSANSQSVMSGDPLTYTFTINNSGNIEADNVVLTDVLPEGFSITSISLENDQTTTVYDSSQYDFNETTRLLTLPNASGTPISIQPGSTAILTMNGTLTL